MPDGPAALEQPSQTRAPLVAVETGSEVAKESEITPETESLQKTTTKSETDLFYEIGWPLLSFVLAGRPLHALDVRRRAKIQEGDKVLELGSGYPLYKIYSGKVGETGAFFALDINERIAKRSKKILQLLNILKKKSPEIVIIADARNLPFRDNSMDIIIESNVVSNFSPEKARRTYEEIMRVLKPEGRILSAVAALGSLFPNELVDILNKIGFIDINKSIGTFGINPLYWEQFVSAKKPLHFADKASK